MLVQTAFAIHKAPHSAAILTAAPPPGRQMVSPTRSKIMRSIRSKDTWPELYVRRLVHKNGFRFRLHYPKLPGRPDLAFPRHRAVILVSGCFWHGHNCHIYNPGKIRPAAWEAKIERNRQRDKRNIAECRTVGWRTLVVWECALQGKTKLCETELQQRICHWLLAARQNEEICGKRPTASK